MLDIEKIVKKEYNEWIEICFGNWIHCLFLRGDNKLFFHEQKEVFFLTLKKLLDDGKVVIFHPDSPVNMTQEDVQKWIWDQSSEDIVQYIRDIFPQDIKDENDDMLTNFWYGFAPYNSSTSCPRIGWIDQDTGELVAS